MKQVSLPPAIGSRYIEKLSCAPAPAAVPISSRCTRCKSAVSEANLATFSFEDAKLRLCPACAADLRWFFHLLGRTQSASNRIHKKHKERSA